MNQPIKFVPLPFLAALLTLGIGCGSHDEPSERGELGEYFADIQAINDEYQRRLDDLDKDKQGCFGGFDPNGQDRTAMRAIKARVIECLTEEDGFYSSAREDWLSQMRAVDPPESARAVHQVLTDAGDNDAASPLPSESADSGIDPRTIRFLEACEDLVKLAADNGTRLRMWCSISSPS